MRASVTADGFRPTSGPRGVTRGVLASPGNAVHPENQVLSRFEVTFLALRWVAPGPRDNRPPLASPGADDVLWDALRRAERGWRG